MTTNQRFALIWGTVSFVLGIIMVTFNNSSLVILASFFAKTLAVLLGTLLGLTGAAIGESIRRFALPSGFFTDGRMTSILKTKLFWMVGPQLIGMFLGVAISMGIVLQ